MPDPQIITERLVLSPLVPADAPTLFAYWSLPEVRRYQSWEPASVDDALAFIDRHTSAEFHTPGTSTQFGIRSRGTGELVGDFGVHCLKDGRQVEIGFTLTPAVQGQGLAAEAVTGMLDFLFGRVGTHRVIASVDPRNRRSIRLLERVGMRQEAHFRESLLFKGEWADDAVFAILAKEWIARRPPTERGPSDTIPR